MLKSIVNGAEHDIISIPMKGKNLFNYTIVQGTFAIETGNEQSSPYRVRTNMPDFKLSAGTYTISVDGADDIVIYCYDDNGYVQSASFTGWAPTPRTFTLSSSLYVRFAFRFGNNAAISPSNIEHVMLNFGSTALPYEPYGYQNGWEVRDNQNRIIWGREDELETTTGTLPFKGYDLPVKVKSLLGNATQNGTPSPDNPVIPEMCGVRTENLFDYVSYFDSTFTNYNEYFNFSSIQLLPNTTYTLSTSIDEYETNQRITAFIVATTNQTPTTADGGISSISPVTITTESDGILKLYKRISGGRVYPTKDLFDAGAWLMLNTGSTALQFESYGYKIPFENNGENLWNYTIEQGGWLAAAGSIPTKVEPYESLYTNRCRVADIIPIPYSTMSLTCQDGIKINFVWINADGVSLGGTGWQQNGSTVTAPENATSMTFILAKVDDSTCSPNNFQSIMLYFNETVPVYLGEVPTIRRIKKLVLTGEENWEFFSNNDGTYGVWQFYVNNATNGLPLSSVLSNIASYGVTATTRGNYQYGVYLVTSGTGVAFQVAGAKDIFTDTSAWKSYLATQYQNGTPVTVWYILSEPKTGIVNEPLAKIGDYADELTAIKFNGLSAPLYGIGDYKDTLNLSTGVVTRNVKKLVLTGEEDIQFRSGNARWHIPISDMKTPTNTGSIEWCCSHYRAVANNASLVSYDYMISWSSGDTGSSIGLRIRDIDFLTTTTPTAFKSYLSEQYQNGTPVTIWYVLATPETETVTVPTGMTGEIEGYLTQISIPTPTHQSIPKWNGEEETGGTYAVTVYNLPEIPTTTGKNTLTVDTTLAPYNVTINGHIKYTYWGKIREDVRSGLAQTKFPVGTILYDNEDETTGRAFQVVGYDKHFDPSLTARGYNRSMTLCQLKLSGPWQFDATEAFLYTTVEMQPGTYKFKIPNYDTTYGGNKTYYFTSTASVPVDSQITLSWAYQHLPGTVTAYAGPNPQTKTTAITGFNALQLSEWIEGESPEAIDLGTIKLANNDPDSAYGKLNHIHRARYGSNNYYQSGLRQLLNTDLASNNWWHPTTIFDRPYANRTTNGYLRSLNEDFINVLATPEITHIANNIFEYPSLDGRTFTLNTEYKINTDKVFLLSHTEVGLSASPNIGTVLDYYSTHNTNNDRIKYRIDNGNAYYWWFRTPYPTNAYIFRHCNTSGALDYGSAINSIGVAPAHIIQ